MTRTLAALAVSALCLAAFQASAWDETVLGDFKDGLDGWRFNVGDEFPGSEGNLWHEKTDGGGAAILEGFFKNGGAYVLMAKTFKPPPAVSSVSITLTATDVKTLVFRATDSTGQVFQQWVDLERSGKKSTIVIPSFDKGKAIGHWSGAKDGKWHGPLREIALLIDRKMLGNIEIRPIGQLAVESVKGRITP